MGAWDCASHLPDPNCLMRQGRKYVDLHPRPDAYYNVAATSTSAGIRKLLCPSLVTVLSRERSKEHGG